MIRSHRDLHPFRSQFVLFALRTKSTSISIDRLKSGFWEYVHCIYAWIWLRYWQYGVISTTRSESECSRILKMKWIFYQNFNFGESLYSVLSWMHQKKKKKPQRDTGTELSNFCEMQAVRLVCSAKRTGCIVKRNIATIHTVNHQESCCVSLFVVPNNHLMKKFNHRSKTNTNGTRLA